MRCRANASQRIQRVYEEMTGVQRGCGVTRGDFLNDSIKPSRKNLKIHVFKYPFTTSETVFIHVPTARAALKSLILDR